MHQYRTALPTSWQALVPVVTLKYYLNVPYASLPSEVPGSSKVSGLWICGLGTV